MGNNGSSPSLRSPKTETDSTFELSSESRVDTSTGSHQFRINDYSLSRVLGVGKCICSRTFRVGNYDMKIFCFLEGYKSETKDYISIYIGHNTEVDNPRPRVHYSIAVLDPDNGEARYKQKVETLICNCGSMQGWSHFIKRNELEASGCLRSDCFTIICNAAIMKEPKTYPLKVPLTVKPYALRERLGNLLSIENGADIKLEVDGRNFLAHRSVLAARSPVLRAKLSGPSPTEEGKVQTIVITDIKANIFEALLLYIYTDDVPEIDPFAMAGMTQQLMDATDRFGLDNFRIACEKKICEGLDKNNICTVLALAEQHNLCHLKTACLKYLSSPEALLTAMSTAEFTHLIQNCPTIAREISNNVNLTKPKVN